MPGSSTKLSKDIDKYIATQGVKINELSEVAKKAALAGNQAGADAANAKMKVHTQNIQTATKQQQEWIKEVSQLDNLLDNGKTSKGTFEQGLANARKKVTCV
jgi:hypothetical protein